MTAGYMRRIADIVLGMVVSAVGIVMMLQANIGLEPWSVLQEGMSNTLGITYGTASMIVGAVVVAVSLLCGEPIGLGTVLNIILCALFIDGLLALDWWNGNRSVLSDGGLTGLLLGMTLQTKPEDIYRALIEATAYGTRLIVENYRSHGVPVEEFIASGGIARKDPMTMQIYADVLNMPVKVASSAQGPALGSAIFASVAAGSARGGWDDLYQAIRALGSRVDAVYRPIPEHTAVYGRLFSEYLTLHDYFGRGGNDVMKRLHLQG